MKKQVAALAAAILMTLCVGIAIFAIGGVALANRAGVTPANSLAQSSKVSDASLTQQQGQVQQLQELVAQYQAREKQYQAREQQYQQALDQARAQLQQFQLLLTALQQQGLITIRGSDGN